MKKNNALFMTNVNAAIIFLLNNIYINIEKISLLKSFLFF